jgi:hypothetical protein
MEMYYKNVCFNIKQYALFNIYVENILEQWFSFEIQEFQPVKRIHE